MTNKEILEKAIQKAVDNGWRGFSYEKGWFTGPSPKWFLGEAKYYEDTHDFACIESGVRIKLNELIYNHDFAKATWGDDSNLNGYGDDFVWYTSAQTSYGPGDVIEKWQYHLQMMVIADDPIKYLGEHI